MSPAEFISTTLRQIRADFFAGSDEKKFYQEQQRLKRAITYPARWLRRRGGYNITIGLMREIMENIIRPIKMHANPTRRLFSIKFEHCVQQHMIHHGDDYLQKAKRMPHISSAVSRAMADIRSTKPAVDPGAVLAETNKALGRGRRTIRKSATSEPDFFLKPLQLRKDRPDFPQTSAANARDS